MKFSERVRQWFETTPASAADADRAEPQFTQAPAIEIRNDFGDVGYQVGPLADALKYWSGGGLSKAGPAVTVESADRLSWVNACERVIGTAMAYVPIVIYRRGAPIGPAKRASREPAIDLPTYRVLHTQANIAHTAYTVKRLWARDLFYRGMAYGTKIKAFGGGYIGVERQHPDKMEAFRDDMTGKFYFMMTRPDGRRIKLQQEEVFYVFENSDDGVRGMTPMAVHRETIGAGIAMRNHGSTFYRNQARPGVVLSTDKKIAEGKDQMRADFEKYALGDAAGSTVILDNGVKAEKITIDNEDAQYIETMKFNRTEIASIYGVPLHKIGDLENAHFANVESQNIEFVVDCLDPKFECWQQAIDRDFLDGDPRYYSKFNVGALLKGNALDQAQALQIERRNGVRNANEWRELLDLNPRADDDGEEYIVESNMTDGNDKPAAERTDTQRNPKPKKGDEK